MKKIIWFTTFLFPVFVLAQNKENFKLKENHKYIVVTDQDKESIDIINLQSSKKIVWSWKAEESEIDSDKIRWFHAPDEAKPVFNNTQLLINASGGGVALIRIADKTLLFYGYAGQNPHSSEILPDGNIVTASSTDNKLTLFQVDTTDGILPINKTEIFLPFAHNVVWDKKRTVLWSAAKNKLYQFRYNFDKENPRLMLIDSLILPGNQAHDLFPVYGKDALWLTDPKGVFTVRLKDKKIQPTSFKLQHHIKSVSSGPKGWPVLMMKPEEQWWSDKVLDSRGNIIFQQKGMKIYKARWMLPNPFSYNK